jgi:hypothetical protein
MINHDRIELFVLKCAVIETDLRSLTAEYEDPSRSLLSGKDSEILEPLLKQFDLENRRNASSMAKWYQIFYMLENDIRRLVAETLENADGVDWWNSRVAQGVKDEAKRNKDRETQAAHSTRSDEEIDYITFGQLQEIIKDNWGDFAGMLSNQSAVSRVLSGLNMLRGTIAHCGVLADDEVDRLKLAIRDWFRVLQGPGK